MAQENIAQFAAQTEDDRWAEYSSKSAEEQAKLRAEYADFIQQSLAEAREEFYTEQ